MRQVVAMGGGGWSMDDPALDRFVLGLTDARRPRVCLIPTASGDHPSAERFREAFPAAGFDATILWLFDREVADIGAFLGEQDVVYVGGGNTVSMLAVWRAHGVDRALRDAYDAGVVMAGVSAGANCWFEACTTDSFALGRADLLLDGLGFVAGSFTPHYDSEPARRPAVLELVASHALPPGFACDDYAAVHVIDGDLREAVRSRPESRVFRVEPGEGGTREEPLGVRLVA
ncbi:MAG: Type 1 glutamine amidotransferase-like domain-containing protein [Actinomycetota bacterium]